MSTPNVFPSIRYADAPAAMRWLTEAFGAVLHTSSKGPGNTIAHAELRFGDGIVMVGSTAPPSENPWTRVRTGVYVAVADPDAHHARAVAAGATILRPLADTHYGAREYTAGDLEGHLWSFGTYRPSHEGRPDVTPDVHYRDGRAAIAFLQRAFGFVEQLVVPGAGDTIAHAELFVDPGYVMLDSAASVPERAIWNGQTHGVCVATDEVDAHYARARAAGAQVVIAIEDTPYGSRGYTARDPEGFLWSFGTYRPGATSTANR